MPQASSMCGHVDARRADADAEHPAQMLASLFRLGSLKDVLDEIEVLVRDGLKVSAFAVLKDASRVPKAAAGATFDNRPHHATIEVAPQGIDAEVHP